MLCLGEYDRSLRRLNSATVTFLTASTVIGHLDPGDECDWTSRFTLRPPPNTH